MRVAGVDYSLSSPAICVHEGEEWSYDNCTFYYYVIVSQGTSPISSIKIC